MQAPTDISLKETAPTFETWLCKVAARLATTWCGAQDVGNLLQSKLASTKNSHEVQPKKKVAAQTGLIISTFYQLAHFSPSEFQMLVVCCRSGGIWTVNCACMPRYSATELKFKFVLNSTSSWHV
jgi:hypothetical protein